MGDDAAAGLAGAADGALAGAACANASAGKADSRTSELVNKDLNMNSSRFQRAANTKSSRKGFFEGEQMKSACYCGANGRSSTGASGARWFLGLARGNGIDQHERLGQISMGGRRDCDRTGQISDGHDAAARSAYAALVSGVR